MTKYGLHVIFWKELVKNPVYQLTGIANLLEPLTGTEVACMQTSPIQLLRTAGSKAIYEQICEGFRPFIKEHIEVYGADNHLRLTGKHETASINDFSFGVSDRGASIRIPIGAVDRGWKGWLEDRRPNSAADPYKVAARIIKTVKAAEAGIAKSKKAAL